jgi:hypothetical protein
MNRFAAAPFLPNVPPLPSVAEAYLAHKSSGLTAVFTSLDEQQKEWAQKMGQLTGRMQKDAFDRSVKTGTLVLPNAGWSYTEFSPGQENGSNSLAQRPQSVLVSVLPNSFTYRHVPGTLAAIGPSEFTLIFDPLAPVEIDYRSAVTMSDGARRPLALRVTVVPGGEVQVGGQTFPPISESVWPRIQKISDSKYRVSLQSEEAILQDSAVETAAALGLPFEPRNRYPDYPDVGGRYHIDAVFAELI